MSSSPILDTSVGKKSSTIFDPNGWHDCPWCGAVTRVEFVHHYCCTSCHRPIHDCCDGETSTNQHDSGAHH